MGKCVSKESLSSLNRKKSLTKESDISERSLDGQNNRSKSYASRSDRTFIRNSLKQHYLFKQLDKGDMKCIILRMKNIKVTKDSLVYEQGSSGSKFYIISKGHLTILRDNKIIETLNKGDTFGELALLTQSNRKESIKSENDSILWSLGRNSFKIVLKQIFSKNFDSYREFIAKVPFFSNAADSQKDYLTRMSVLHEYKPSETLNNESELIFIILEGRVLFGSKILSKGDYFGEIAILTGNTLKYTTITLEKTKILSIDTAALINAFGENFREYIFKNIARFSIDQDDYLEFLSKENIIMLVESLEWNQYSAGEVVIPVGYDKESKFIVVCTGELRSSKNEHIISAFQVIGLQNPNDRSILAEDYKAGADTIVGEITASSIESLLNISLESIFKEADSIKVLRKISIFKYLTLAKLKLISSKMYEEDFEKKEIIFSYKDPASQLYLIKEGNVEIFHEGKIFRSLGKYDYFGEKCLNEEKRSASARCVSRVHCWVLAAEDFRMIMDESISLELERRKYYQADILLNNLMYVKTINDKPPRQLYVAYYTAQSAYYAVQVINKCENNTQEQFLSLIQEKNINLQLDFHLVIKLVKTFQNEDYVFFVTEHIDSVNLRVYMKSQIRENAVRYLVSCLSTILEYLHDKEIIYRDLCPENILINYQGIPHLYNFSASKIVKGRTYTNIGNPYYKSPEIFTGRGYSKSVDYWSLGVLTYELLYSILPFNILYSDDPVTVYEKILAGSLKFPETRSYVLANELIEKLLVKEQNKAKAEDIKKSSWMKNVDWDKLQRPSSQSFIGPKIPISRLKSLKESDLISLERFIHENSFTSKGQTSRRSVLNPIRWDKYF